MDCCTDWFTCGSMCVEYGSLAISKRRFINVKLYGFQKNDVNQCRAPNFSIAQEEI